MPKIWIPFAFIVIIISCFPIQDFDLFWHLKTGETILAHGIPKQDPFSPNSRGDWVNHAWGFDIVAHGVDQAGGVSGLILLRLLIAGGLGALILLSLMKRGFGTALSLAVTALALALARHRLDLRPDELAHLLFAALLFLAFAKKWRWIPLLLLAWVNLHASFLLGIGAALLFYFLLWLRERKWEALLLGAAALLLPMANPFGWKAYVAPVLLQMQVKTMGLVNPEWQVPPLKPLLPFFITAILFAGLLLIRRKSLSPEHLLLLPLAFLAFSSLRFIGFFAVAMAFFLPRLKPVAVWPVAGLAVAMLGFSFVFYAPPGWGLDAHVLPVNETRFLSTLNPDSPVFCSPGLGGYLIYKLYPRQKVFWDGRNELYKDLLEEAGSSLHNSAAWEGFLEKHRIGWALVRYQGEEKVRSTGGVRILPWSVNHFPLRDWMLAYWDDAGMIFIRRGPAAIPELNLNPESTRFIAQELKSARLDGVRARRELEDKLRENGKCRRARRLLTSLFP